MAVVTTCSDFGAQENKICHCFHFPPTICHEVMGLNAMVFCQEPAHKIPPMTRSWGENLTSKADQDSRDFKKASTWDPTHDKVMRRKPDEQGGSGSQGFWKAAPGPHLKGGICLSGACFNRLLPNFCDTGRRPSPISFHLELYPICLQGGGILWDYPGWKECFNLNSFAGILVCLANVSIPLVLICMIVHNTLTIKQHKEPDHIKALIDIEPFRGWGSPIRKHKKNYSKSGYWVNVCLLCFCS